MLDDFGILRGDRVAIARMADFSMMRADMRR